VRERDNAHAAFETMPSRRKRGKKGLADAPHGNENGEVQSDGEQQLDDATQQQQQQSTATPAQPHLKDTDLSVLLDEEDSYRLVWEHDEHLARIRAYTDFYDMLALLKRAGRTAAAAGEEGELNSPNPHAPPSLDRTPTNVGDLTLHSASRQPTPFTSIDRETILATAAPPGAYESSWGGLTAPGVIDPRLISRLEAEKGRLAQELLASQNTIQQLQASLQEARQTRAWQRPGEGKDEEARLCDGSVDAADVAPLQGPSRLLLRPPLASPSSLSSLTNSASREHSNAAPSGPPAATATETRTTQQRADGDECDELEEPERSHTQQFVPPPSMSPPAQPSHSHSRPLSPSLQRSVHASPAGAKPIDVSDFFWTLQVAPPPDDLHERCAHPEHCHAASMLLRSPPEGGGSGHRSYGATANAAASSTAAACEEAVALACESAWVDSSFYCYNIMEEMSCLRVVRSWEDVADSATTRNPLAQMTEDEVTQRLLDRTPGTTPAAQSLQFFPTGSAAEVPSAASTSDAATATAAAAMTFGGYGNVVSAQVFSASSQRYCLPYLQRLWVTSVLRQYLLFLLLTISCVLLLIPGMMIGAINVFEAAAGDDFYATRNRFGRSALLIVARLGSCCLVLLLFFGFICAESGRRHAAAVAAASASASAKASPESASNSTNRKATPLPAGDSDNANTSSAAAAAAAASPPPPTITTRRPTPIGTLVHVVLCFGAALVFAGSLAFHRSCAARSLPFALLSMALYGAGEAFLLGGIGTIMSAEVGVAAGVNISLQILLSNWLLVNAFGLFVVPKLSYYVYSPSQLLRSLVFTAGTICAFVFGLVMLCPRDLIERAARAHAKFLSPHKLLSAARHDISLCFYLRALTVGLLTAGMVLVLLAGAAIFVPSQAEAASVSESMKSKELMGTGSGKRNTADTATDAGLIASSIDRWSSQQRHAPVYVFFFALLLVPLCFIPRLAAVINRWCPVVVMTTLLCLMWAVSTASSWATVLGLSPVSTTNNDKDKEGRLWTTWIWTGEHHLFNPSTQLCGVATGVMYTIVVSSLLRAIANAGVQLPILHPARWRMAFHERDDRRHGHTQGSFASGSSSSPVTESSPLVSGSRKSQEGGTGTSDEVEFPAVLTAGNHHYNYDERLRCVRMQLRGGPAMMTVLVALLILIVLVTCVTVAMVVSALLTDRSESPIYVSAVMPEVTWDEHLLVKTVLTCVFAAAMVVQWVEVFHRVCSSCCC
jgi:hypothetical protein